MSNVGQEIIERLREIAEHVETGEPLEAKYRVRTLERTDNGTYRLREANPKDAEV